MSERFPPQLRFRYLWLFLGYMLVALVSFMSLTSNPIDTGIQILHIDKLYHMLAYFVLMAWFAQMYHARTQRYLIAIVFIAMGCFFEYFQSLDVKRYAELADIVANSLGVIFGFILTMGGVKNTLFKFETMFR